MHASRLVLVTDPQKRCQHPHHQDSPLFEDVNRKIESKAAGVILGKTWKLGENTCRAEFTKENWQKLLLLVRDRTGLSPEQAHQIREAVTLAPQRVDYRDRWRFAQQPAHRVCASKFFDEGLLLPFGASREEFTVPNPYASSPLIITVQSTDLVDLITFFQSADWPMMDSASPLNGWSAPDVLETGSGPASSDVYGKLFYHIRSHLANFHDRLTHHGNDFTFFNVDDMALKTRIPSRTKNKSFARIELINAHHLKEQSHLLCSTSTHNHTRSPTIQMLLT